MICFEGKPFNITVIQVYDPTSNPEEAEVEQFYENLQDLLKLIPKNDVLSIIGNWNAKVGCQETPRITGKFGTLSDRESAWRTMDGSSWHCTGGSDQEHPQEIKMQKGKIVWGGLTNNWEKKRSKRQRRKERYTH